MSDKLLIFSFVFFGLNFIFSCFIYIWLLMVESSLSNLQDYIKCCFDE